MPAEPLRFAFATTTSDTSQLQIKRIPDYKVEGINKQREVTTLTIESLAAKSHALAMGSHSRFGCVDPPARWQESRRALQSMARDRGVELALCAQLLRGCALQCMDADVMVKRVEDMSHTVNMGLIEAKAADVNLLSYDAIFKRSMLKAKVSAMLKTHMYVCMYVCVCICMYVCF